MILKSKYRITVFSIALISFLAIAMLNNISTKVGAWGFDPGNIITDEQMSFYNSMSEADIQQFLKSKNSCNDRNLGKRSRYPRLHYNVRDGHFVCMADDSFDGESAAHIIYQTAQDYRINPRVLLVLLQKEQGLITDTWPNSNQYRKATGFGCPDSGQGCDARYFGLKNQLRHAAQLFRAVLDGGWSNYSVGWNSIYYHPNRACGSSMVNIRNRATASLYRYTPYQPNNDTLIGRHGGCSAYGNLNFFNYYSNWFGDPRSDIVGWPFTDYYNQNKLSEAIGMPTSRVVKLGNNYWQNFARGAMYWIWPGIRITKGGIGERYAQLGMHNSNMGYPMENEESHGNAWWQNFQNGAIIGTIKTGFWESRGGIRERWSQLGWQGGSMGYPTTGENWDGRGWWQNYEQGAIVGTIKTGFWESRGGIRATWRGLNFECGVAGYPIGPEIYDGNNTWHQDYEHGRITFSFAKGGAFTRW